MVIYIIVKNMTFTIVYLLQRLGKDLLSEIYSYDDTYKQHMVRNLRDELFWYKWNRWFCTINHPEYLGRFRAAIQAQDELKRIYLEKMHGTYYNLYARHVNIINTTQKFQYKFYPEDVVEWKTYPFYIDVRMRFADHENGMTRKNTMCIQEKS